MWKAFLNTLLPHRCLRCEVILAGEPGLCSQCWSLIQFISPCFCAQCGLPLELDLGEDALCAVCARGDNYFSRVQSVFVYDDASKELILKFKHGDAHYVAPTFAHWMVQAQKGILESGFVLTPVPLHWTRLFRRSYNQSQILAKEIAKIRPDLQYVPDLLRRVRATSSQGRLNREQRYKNIKGSIKIPSNKKKLIKGKNVVLVDDVLTSGATLNACAQTLLKAGAAGVNGLTLGRVTRN